MIEYSVSYLNSDFQRAISYVYACACVQVYITFITLSFISLLTNQFQNQLETYTHSILYTYDPFQFKSKFNSHQFSNLQWSFSNLLNNITTSFKLNNIYVASLLISRLTSCLIVPQKKLSFQHINPIIEIRSLASHLDTHSLSDSLYLLASLNYEVWTQPLGVTY